MAHGIFSISETNNRIKDITVSIRYISIKFDRKSNNKESQFTLSSRPNAENEKNIKGTSH